MSARHTETRSFYRDAAPAEAQMSPPLHRKIIADMLDRAPARPHQTALDIGTGVGLNLEVLQSRFDRVVALDLSTSAVREARIQAPRVLVGIADAVALPIATGSVDAVVCTEVLEHVPPWERVAEEMVRVLRPGGIAVISTPNYLNLMGALKWRRDLGRPYPTWEPWGAHAGGYERPVTSRSLLRLFRDRFRVLTVRGSFWSMGWIDPIPWAGRIRVLRSLDRLGHLPFFRTTSMHVHLLLELR